MTDHRYSAGGGPAGANPGPAGHEPPPPGAHFMNVLRWALFAGLLLLAVVAIGSYVASRRPDAGASSSAKAARYHCPMHPSYTSDRPGECPICGMRLEPVPDTGEDHAAHGDSASGGGGDVPGLTSVQISPERIQLIGVRTAVVTRRALGSRLDLVGFVTPDERRLRRVQVRAAGWIRKLHVNQTGEWIREGQPLITIYSPELFQSEQEFLIELGARDSSDVGPHESGGLAASRERLRLLGVPDEEVRRLERERTVNSDLVLRAPVSGTVLERNVVEGQYVAADTPLLSIADLSSVWILADLYEMDFGRVKVGDRAEFRVDALPGRTFHGRVEFVYPTVSSDTRTLKVRFSLADAGGALRPGMYGRAVVHAGSRPVLAVPTEAIVNAGEHDYACLAHAGGRFEPRIVTVGQGDGTWTPVLRGLAEGDTVVASASFLIDSESRLRAAISGMGQPSGGHDHGGTP
ncbi:MAG TPA: efflux RND transporter periplasmic adaptor subunit [Candidatus Eisenbacteria bacterium]|nr:efflux RND transporter periplasmic adaptor subunit [Candidatus Eisenbacteria bacterium]